VGNPDDKPVVAVADFNGIAQFSALPADAQSAVKALLLHCQDTNGHSGLYNIDLTSAATFAPLPVPSRPPSSLRPGLTGDPMSYSRQELIANGYGLRPDPLTSPDAYAAWLKAALQSAVAVKGVNHPMPMHASSIISSIPADWSGGMFSNSLDNDHFEQAQGNFTVPSSTPTTACSAASIWTGLGGWNVLDLIQTGVQLVGNTTVVAVHPWIEYFSGFGVGGSCYATECYVGLNVSAGDSLLTQVWACNANYSTQYTGGYGCFYLYDYNTQQYSFSQLKQINTFQGQTAEIIAENNAPNNVCGANGTYTDFGSVQNAAFWTYDTSGTLHDWQSDPNGYYQVISVDASNYILGIGYPNPNSYLITLSWLRGS
jgi:hypothetical protein